jgi:hypothetical protein
VKLSFAFLKRRSFYKKMLVTFCVLAVLWLAGCVAIYRVMCKPPEQFARVMSKMPGPVPFLLLPFETLWLRARAGKLGIGDHAPDFVLTKLDKTEQIQLSSLTAQNQPVVLVFGSYT